MQKELGMCYHFKDADTADYVEWMITKYKIKKYYWKGKFYINGYEHKPSLVMAQGMPDDLVEMEWGLIPFWVKTKKDADIKRKGNLNAKAETIFELPSFRHCIKKQKCLVLADGFYEWRHINSKLKIPYLIGRRHPEHPQQFYPFTFGAIYDTWVNNETGEVTKSFSVITVEANDMMRTIHNSKQRMPLIIPDYAQELWLSTTDAEVIKSLMVPFPSEQMRAYPIASPLTQSSENRNTPLVTEPQKYAEVEFEEFL